MINLSSVQESVVNAPIGEALQILASAGAGKTRVLTERIRKILDETKKDGVIAFTFTNKAAEEMQQRLSDIDDVSDRCWIATTHSVAQRILEQYGHVIGLPTGLHIYEREPDRKAVFVQAITNEGLDVDTYLGSNEDYARRDREKRIQNYMEQFSIIKRELLSDEEIEKRHEETPDFLRIYKAYQDTLLQGGGIDFDDILVYSLRILVEQPWCGDIYRAKYKHLFVDEAQDLNKAQYEFIKALCGEKIKSIMMVGDPNQMIYGFNGSSEDYLCLHYKNDFNPRTIELKENYRSSRSVIRLANKLKPNSQIESDYALQGFSHLETFDSEETEAAWIVRQIDALLKMRSHSEIEGAIDLEKIAVIASNRYVFSSLESLLEANNIPYCVKKPERRADPTSVFGKVLDLAIRLRVNSKDWIDGKKLYSILGVSPPKSWDNPKILGSLATEVRLDENSFSTIIADLLDEIDQLDPEEPKIPKFASKFSTALTGYALTEAASDIEEADIATALEEFEDLKACWTAFKRKNLGNSLSAFRNAMALGQLSQETNLSGLTLSTVHTMKGLEKDIIFLMGMCEGTFPDYRSVGKREIEEELNKAFVAVTRARRWIYITCPLKKKMPWGDYKSQRPSRFLIQMTT